MIDKKAHIPNYIEYIFNLIMITENFVILNKNEDMFKFIAKAQQKLTDATPINLFDEKTLITYDTTVRLLANAIFERVPKDEGVDLDDTPSLDQFRAWIRGLKDIDIFVLLYFLTTRGYIILDSDDQFDFIISVILSIQVL